MKRRVKLLAMLLVFCGGCKKTFIATDISKMTIVVNAPASGQTTTSNLVTFWWSEIEGADSYNLQIVSPTFSNTVRLFVDTFVASEKFNFTLPPGDYEWRVKAVNNASETKYVVSTLKVDTTSNLGQQYVLMRTPLSGEITGQSNIHFSWDAVHAADKYQLRVNQGSLIDTIIPGTEITLSLPVILGATATFTWNVRAINGQSEGPFNSEGRVFVVDRKAPGTPALSKPFDGALVSPADTLSWISGAGSVGDSVFVSTDSTFENLSGSALIEGGKVILAEFGLTPTTSGTQYWWRVMSIDQVGNKSQKSSKRRFTLLP
jgi:hypothetical protein